jgi:hypothetical protein
LEESEEVEAANEEVGVERRREGGWERRGWDGRRGWVGK